MRNRPLCSVCLIVFILLCVSIRAGGEKIVKELRPSPLERRVRTDETIQFTGRVYQKEIKDKYQILYLKHVKVTYQKQSLMESKIIVYDETKQKIGIGNVVKGNGTVSFFERSRNPGNFDQKLYYQRQQIHASVWAKSVKIVSKTIEPIKNRLYELRSRWKVMLCRIMGEKDGSTFSAILLGEKSGMDRELKELYQVNGIAHILAISGLHLSLIGVGMYRLLRRVTGSYPVGGIFGILFLLSYILMIGFTVSAVRALIMFLFRVGADITGRHYDSPTALSVAAVIVIIWRPLYLYDGGFWLSFGAVLATILILPVFEELPLKGLAASVSINLMLFPILLYYFYEIPLYSVLLNLVVIPLLSVLLVAGLIGSACCVSCVPLGYAVLGLCSLIFRLYEWLCQITIQFPGARIITGQPEVWKICLYYGLLAVAVALMRWNMREKDAEENRRAGSRRRNSIVSGALVCAGILLLVTKVGRTDELQITLLDVGQGDCIFMKDKTGMTYLVDGGSSDVPKVGEYRIEPYLLWKGVDTLDYVFLSHGDSDHVSGIEELLERQRIGVKIGALVLPDRSVWDETIVRLAQKAMENRVKVLEMTEARVLKNTGMEIACIQPGKEGRLEPGNEASMVLAVRDGTFDMLLTGDVEEEGEKLLMKKLEEQYPTTTWEVLKVSHHGSKNSTSEQFLEITKPMYSIISAGIDNRYGHPHRETVERLTHAGSKVYSTQNCGAVTIRVKDRHMYLEGHLEETKE